MPLCPPTLPPHATAEAIERHLRAFVDRFRAEDSAVRGSWRDWCCQHRQCRCATPPSLTVPSSLHSAQSVTRWDDSLSYSLSTALASYELVRRGPRHGRHSDRESW